MKTSPPALAALALLLPLLALAQAPPPALLPPRAPGQLYDPSFGDLEALISPPPPAAPPSHQGDFLRRHSALARADGAACLTCHRQQECLDCHNGALRPLALHPPGYLAWHAIEARKDAQSCASCHSPQTFCRQCHDLTRLGTDGPARPAPGLRVHPESWLGATPGPQHGHEARRNLTACASCHTEQDCLRCHVNLNPHPPAWRDTCARALRRNPAPCLRCHLDPDRIQTLCQ
jgi:hypothetical protein